MGVLGWATCLNSKKHILQPITILRKGRVRTIKFVLCLAQPILMIGRRFVALFSLVLVCYMDLNPLILYAKIQNQQHSPEPAGLHNSGVNARIVPLCRGQAGKPPRFPRNQSITHDGRIKLWREPRETTAVIWTGSSHT